MLYLSVLPPLKLGYARARESVLRAKQQSDLEEGPMSAALLEGVRGLRVANPGLSVKPLLAKLREQQPDLVAGDKEVREALAALKAESDGSAVAVRECLPYLQKY